ncbi:MAG: restriction endonuclease subunit S, partial [Treponema sp.]
VLPEITEDEIPFDIPESWCWCRLGELITFVGGYAYDSHSFIDKSDYQVLRLGNVKNGYLQLSAKPVFINAELAEKTNAFKCITNDILVTMTGTRLKRDYFFTTLVTKYDENLYINQRVGCLRPTKFIFANFLAWILKSKPILDYIFEFETGTANQGNLGSENIKTIPIPLPPLAEQKRIVAAIEKFMPLIEEYGKKETQLKAINEKIGTLTKKAILQEAVQGKLVPQIASEGNARDLLEEIRKEKLSHGLDFANAKSGKRKSKKETALAGSNPCDITEDEIPFDIPENWCWCRLGEIVQLTSGQDLQQEMYNSSQKGIPYITGASNFNNGNVIINRWTETPKSVAIKDDLLLTCKGTVGEMAFLKEKKVHIARQVMSIRSSEKISLGYVKIYLTTQIENLKSKAKSMIPGIAREDVISSLIPLPPLAEQKRIVAAIEKMLPLCEKLGE